MFARQKRADETSPCEIIRIRDPAILQSVLIIAAAITSPMWLTEEKAISDFMSVWREHNIADNKTPNNENTISGAAAGMNESSVIVLIRKIPYPPSFSKVPAKIIDPAIGASTCAFGSHKCTPYKGILIRNARKQAIHHMRVHEDIESSVGDSLIIEIDSVPKFSWKNSKAVNKAIEPNRV